MTIRKEEHESELRAREESHSEKFRKEKEKIIGEYNEKLEF